MARPIGLVLVGLGAFCLTLGPLTRFYIAEEVVRAPLDYYQSTKLEAAGAKYFDVADFKARDGVALTANNIVRGDVRASKDKNIAVWDSITEIYDKERDRRLEIQMYRIAFDRRTSALVNCCGSHVGGDTKVRMQGYGLLFPLAHVQKRDYPVFDTQTRRPLPMRYDGEDRVQGLKVYRFVQDVPKFKTAKVDYKLSGKMLGIGKKNDLFKVDRYFSATVTAWVDPRTGMPVKHSQKIHSTVETASGRGSMIIADADLVTIERDQKKNVAKADRYASQISLVRTRIPVVALIAGLFLLLLGGVLTLLGGRSQAAGPSRGPDGKFGGGGEGAVAAAPPPPPPGEGEPIGGFIPQGPARDEGPVGARHARRS